MGKSPIPGPFYAIFHGKLSIYQMSLYHGKLSIFHRPSLPRLLQPFLATATSLDAVRLALIHHLAPRAPSRPCQSSGLEDDFPLKLGDFQGLCQFSRDIWTIFSAQITIPEFLMFQGKNLEELSVFGKDYGFLKMFLKPIHRITYIY